MKIQNRFEYDCLPQKLYEAIAASEGITHWWTDQCDVGSGQMVFHWRQPNWRVVIKPLALIPNEYIKWICFDSNMQDTDAWKDSTLSFRIAPLTSGGSVLEFLHDNYKSSPCFNECTAGWAFVLGKSLKSFVETGKGMPFENDRSKGST